VRTNRSADVGEPFSDEEPHDAPAASSGVSAEVVALLAGAVTDYVERGGVPEALVRVAAQLCTEARTRGLTLDATLEELRRTLAVILATSSLTPSDRAGLLAIAVDAGVHAYYRGGVE
jgi:hypothetical protein